MSSKRRGLGKGVDALFPADVTEKPDEAELARSKVEGKSSKLEVRSSHVEGKRSGDKRSEVEVITSEVEGKRSKLEGISYNQDAMQVAIRAADKNPRITLWSPISTAVLKYLRKTTPEFSISEEAGSLLEDAIKRKYPELYEGLKREKEGS